MPPPHFKLLESFSRDLFLLLLLNTIKRKEEEFGGMPFTEFQKMDFIPHSRIYRVLKRLDDNGLLATKEEHCEIGRPKLLYHITEKGHDEIEKLSNKLNSTFEGFKESFPQLLHGGTFENLPVISDPEKHFDDEMQDVPLNERLEFLLEVEHDITLHLMKIREKIKTIEKILGKNESKEGRK